MKGKALLSPHHPLQIALGLVIWSLWFVALYGGLSVVCALAPPDPRLGPWNALNYGLGASALLTVSLLGVLAVRAWRAGQQRRNQGFVALLAAGLHTVAALATLFIALPLLQLPPCV